MVYNHLSLFRNSEIFSVVSHLKCRAALIVKVALHLRWLTTEKFQNYETVKGACIPSKNNFKTQKHIKLTWLVSDMNFKLLHIGCPIAHVQKPNIEEVQRLNEINRINLIYDLAI